ncbi:MAG: dihydrofolate reductase family protein, partial [Verrucomicrobia bacterium]|nr:dihydrofolate reductase family protein [Verrucomicrobiota bacterium]
EFVTDDIPTFLKKLGAKKLWLVGGAALAESFAKFGKIDEYIVTVFPLTLHDGIPLTVLQKSKLEKISSTDFGDGVIQDRYRPLKDRHNNS